MKPHSKKLLPILAVLLSTQSCIDRNNFDFKNVESVSLQPSVALPLLHGNLTIKDLLPKEGISYLTTDQDNLIHLIYSDTLASRSILEYFLLPQLIIDHSYPIVFTGSGLPGSTQSASVSDQVDLDLGYNEADFDLIKLQKGKVTVLLQNTAGESVNVEVSFPTIKDNGQALVIKKQIPANTPSPVLVELDLTDFEIDLGNYGTGQNIIPVDILMTATNEDGSLMADGLLDLELELKELEYSLLTGYFGQLAVDLPSDEVALEAFENIFSKSNYGFKDTKLSLDILNSNGVPIEATINQLVAKNPAGDELDIQIDKPNPVFVEGQTAPGSEAKITSLNVTNVEEAIKFGPSVMAYRLSGQINPNGRTNTPNFLTANSQTAAVLNADIPLWGYLEGFTLTETFALGIALENEADYIKDASFKVVVKNQLPLDATVKLDFVDANNQVLETLFLNEPNGYMNLIPGSQVDANGNMVKEGVLNEEIPVTPERFERMLKAEKAVMTATFSTSQLNGTYPHVKIKANQALNISVGVKTSAENLIIKLENEAEEQ